MLNWIRQLFGAKYPSAGNLREVPGAASYRGRDGKVIYNMLDPAMQQFMGKCVGVLKKAGLKAKGTGQFSILIGENQCELNLDEFWAEFADKNDSNVFEKVVEAAKNL